MSRRALAAVLVVGMGLGSWGALARAEAAPEQTIWLKNGGFLRGSLVELVPGDHVTVQLVTGELRKIPASEIDRMSTGAGGSAAPTAIPAPTAPATSATPPVAIPSPSAAPALSLAPLRVVAPGGAGVEIEWRKRLDPGGWARVCQAPCELGVLAIDREFRAAGPGIQPSRSFLLEPGERPVSVEVRPGQASLHRWGTLAFLVGLPVMLAGGVGIGLDLGTKIPHNETYGTVGLVTAAVGGALLLTSLPLLYSGQTRVLNDKGIQIARKPSTPLFLGVLLPLACGRPGLG
ncbi:MAG: hypothetical protein MUF64_13790 [Polyangiaceae bacterium]|jgi:hypothetical protein|nr:hypothetical protein [Polyangiaceae bacterium]